MGSRKANKKEGELGKYKGSSSRIQREAECYGTLEH